MSIFSDFDSVLRVSVLAACAFVLGACAEPLQSGGVVMFGGADARFDAMCRFRRGADGQESSCAPSTGEAQRATALRIASESQLVRGPKAEGAVGDVLLTNGEISVIFGGPNNSRPGVMLDVADAHVGQDELGFLATCVPAATGCIASTAPEFGQERDGSAWVEVRLVDPKPFEVRTRYTLLAGARALLVTTIVSTPSIEPLRLSRLDDLVAWGSTLPMVPAGEAPGIVSAIGAQVAYALTPVGERPGIPNESPENGMYVSYGREIVVSASRPVQFERALVVTPRGDSLGVLTELSFLREGKTPGAIEVRFAHADGSPWAPSSAGRIRLISPSLPIDAFLNVGVSPEPAIAAEAPPGRYELEFEGAGRRAVTRVSVEVRSGEVVQATIVLQSEQPVTP